MEYSLGLVEVSALGNAIKSLDDMLKAGDVEFVATERKLGGRLVTVVVRGELTAVQASVDAGVATAKANECLKAYQVIARPHNEILKFLHLDEEHEKAPTSEIAGTHVGSVAKKTAPARGKSAAETAAKNAASPKKTAAAAKTTEAAVKPAVKAETAEKTAEKTVETAKPAPKRRSGRKKSEQ